MQDSRIYSDFSKEAKWIRLRVASDVASLPLGLKALAQFYTQERLRILPGISAPIAIDPNMGRPVPYAAFWFANALGLSDNYLMRLSGLCLVYNSLSTTLMDDIDDSAQGGKLVRAKLSEYWFRKYLAALEGIFPTKALFIQTTTWAEAEWQRYRVWNFESAGRNPLQPFSSASLIESSRYFVAVVLPTLAGIAYASHAEDQVPRIERFLRYFSQGWRIFDDLMDWEKDLVSGYPYRSSVLRYIHDKNGGKTSLDRPTVLSWFLSREFIKDSYGAMIGFLTSAQRVARSFGNRYLATFMEQQIEFHSKRRDSMLRAADLQLSMLQDALLEATS
ncbi:MAG: hypothetical protein OK404_01170 [Thaumarchaeota archaeon]|nr:hypothetical protein [Nitrososphaerota archaeon]